jgi:hypothetical protein
MSELLENQLASLWQFGKSCAVFSTENLAAAQKATENYINFASHDRTVDEHKILSHAFCFLFSNIIVSEEPDAEIDRYCAEQYISGKIKSFDDYETMHKAEEEYFKKNGKHSFPEYYHAPQV